MTTFIVAGLVVGGIYAISALGLVLTYASSRVFNFAHGAIAFFLATLYYWLVTEHGWPEPLAAVASVGVVAPILGLGLWAVLFRRLTHAPPTVRLVSTIGLWVALPPLTYLLFGDDPVFQAPGLGPDPPRVFRPLGVAVNSNQLAVLIGAAVIAAALTATLRWTSFGLAVRATVDSPRTAAITGTNPSLVTAGSWMIGTTLAGVAGVLLTPVLGMEQRNFTLLIVASFAAAAIARLTSLPLAFGGALLLGVLQEVSVRYLPDTGILSTGLRPSMPFIVMAAFLLLYRGLESERFDRDGLSGPALSQSPSPGGSRRRWVGVAAAGLALMSLPLWVSSFWLFVLGAGLALALIFLSYVVVTGEGGMISLCQISFAGVGAVVTAQLATNAGLSVLLAVVIGGLSAVPFGLLIALPSLRLGDLYLALATLAFAVLVENLLLPIERFDRFGTGVEVPRPSGFGDDVAFFYFLAAVFTLVAALVVNLRRSPTGLVLGAVRSSAPAAATIGISVVRAKLVTFAFSAFLAGLGGGLLVSQAGRATVASFNLFFGVVWLAVVVTWGVRSVLGALLAGVTYALVPQLVDLHLDTQWGQLTPILFGLGAIAVAREPRGVVVDVIERSRHGRRKRAERSEPSSAPVTAEAAS